jgi:hypothetical protein
MIDITAMLINLSNSLIPVQSFLSGLGYLIGIVLIMSGLAQLKEAGDKKGGSSGEHLAVPLACIGGGVLLLYLPSSFSALSNTVFGATNILSYGDTDPDSLHHALMLLIETTGLLWFVRGTVLLVHASEPGQKQGGKGMTFLIAGVFAMNFDNTIVAFNAAAQEFFSAMATVKQ